MTVRVLAADTCRQPKLGEQPIWNPPDKCNVAGECCIYNTNCASFCCDKKTYQCHKETFEKIEVRYRQCTWYNEDRLDNFGQCGDPDLLEWIDVDKVKRDVAIAVPAIFLACCFLMCCISWCQIYLHNIRRKDYDKAVEKAENKMLEKVDQLKLEHRAN